MKVFVILIIYFGSGKYAQFDVERFNSVEECRAARAAIIAQYAETWTPINGEDAICREVTP